VDDSQKKIKQKQAEYVESNVLNNNLLQLFEINLPQTIFTLCVKNIQVMKTSILNV